MKPRPCGVCGKPIVWGKRPGGDVVPIELDARGPYALLRERFLVTPEYRSWDAIPEKDRAEIPQENRDHWRAAVDGPRYKIHDLACRQAAAMRLKERDLV